MKPLDELRSISDGCAYNEDDCRQWRSCRDHRAALLDAIERELAERYVELPPDVDDEPIHVGDALTWSTGDTATVAELVYYGTAWFAKNLLGEPIHIYNARHYHAPTVEDVLRDYASRILIAGCIDEEDELVAEFAKRLKLAEGEGE